MLSETTALSFGAVSMAFLHCICGPDHYVPFVAMSRVGVWSLRKTLWVTFACGLGHLAGSAAIGAAALTTGFAASRFMLWEAWRGDVAAWLMVAVGAAYALGGWWWTNKPAAAARPHQRPHSHAADRPRRLTPWALFVVFVFGPCEPLIPLLFYPAARASWAGVCLVLALFSATTILTMLAAVTLLHRGVAQWRWPALERQAHCWAGLVIAACGLLMVLGL